MKSPLHKWIKKIPDFPCVLLTRCKYREDWEYSVYVFDWTDNPVNEDEKYLACFDGQGVGVGDIGDMMFGEVFIVNKIKED